MTPTVRSALAVVAVITALGAPRPSLAQNCQDEEAMVSDYEKAIGETVDTVKKETLSDFERLFHQKSSLTKLTLSLSMVDGLISCLDGASSADKDQAAAAKSKREGYAKLKAKIEQYKNDVKAAEAPKDAKAAIEKINLST